MAKVILLLFCINFVNCAVVEHSLLKTFSNKEKIDILIDLASPEKSLKRLGLQNAQMRERNLENVISSLQSHTETSQKRAIQLLEKNSMTYRSFWISNQIFIEDADESLVKLLSKDPEVEKIAESSIIKLDPRENKVNSQQKGNTKEWITWSVRKIGAPDVWSDYNRGEGIVVGNIDTGVRGTHYDLRDNYRTENGWSNQIEDNLESEPFDDDGHGTHTMATIVGQDGIGVAPGAQWIACRACSSDGCPQYALLGCAEFMLCPSGNYTDCQAPHVVSNSWGGGRNRGWFNSAIQSWVAAGIVPVFAIGNEGWFGCSSARSPGDQFDDLLSVGSTTRDDSLSSFSSRGPTDVPGRFKPFISAPGQSIFSASNSSDSDYATLQGTSMACPHVAGAVALLLSDIPLKNSSYENLALAISRGADTQSLTPPGTNCNGNDRVFPNNAYGHGRLNVTASLLHWRSLTYPSSAQKNYPLVILPLACLHYMLAKIFSSFY